MRVLRCSAARAHSDNLDTRCLGRVSGRTSSTTAPVVATLGLCPQALLAGGAPGISSLSR